MLRIGTVTSGTIFNIDNLAIVAPGDKCDVSGCTGKSRVALVRWCKRPLDDGGVREGVEVIKECSKGHFINVFSTWNNKHYCMSVHGVLPSQRENPPGETAAEGKRK